MTAFMKLTAEAYAFYVFPEKQGVVTCHFYNTVESTLLFRKEARRPSAEWVSGLGHGRSSQIRQSGRRQIDMLSES
ncbi:hypothetical protein CHU98_g513 [Xylaria longipes]|nr:hypothetical protein CHU98_g513 [Xylaria longipes]